LDHTYAYLALTSDILLYYLESCAKEDYLFVIKNNDLFLLFDTIFHHFVYVVRWSPILFYF